MSLTYPFVPIPVVSRTGATGNLSSTWVNVYNRVTTSSAINLSLLSDTTNISNAEIIIRNPSTSTDAITIIASGVTIDVSGDLGLIIPPGGIGELKRVGSSTTWDFYGYIEA